MQNAYIMLHVGMMKYLMCGPFEALGRMIRARTADQHMTIDPMCISVYTSLMGLVISTLRECPSIAAELNKNNFHQIVRSLIASDVVNVELTTALLGLPEQLVRSDTQNMEQHIQVLINLLHSLTSQYSKSICILRSLCRILIETPNISIIWSKVNGFAVLLDMITVVNLDDGGVRENHGSLPADSDVTDPASPDSPVLLGSTCFTCVMKTVALVVTLYRAEFPDDPAVANPITIELRAFYRLMVVALTKSRIFFTDQAHQCVDLIFDIISGVSRRSNAHPPRVINPEAVFVISDLLLSVEVKIARYMLQQLMSYITNCKDACQLFCEVGIISVFINKFHDCVISDPSHSLCKPVTEIFKILISSYPTHADVFVIFRKLIRREVVAPNGFLLKPFVSYDGPPVAAETAFSSVGGNKSKDSYNLTSDREWKMINWLLEIANCSDQQNSDTLPLRNSTQTRINGPVPFVLMSTSAEVGSLPQSGTGSTPHISAYISHSTATGKSPAFVNFTYSSWVQAQVAEDEYQSYIPLCTLTSFDSGGCFFEAHFNPVMSAVRVFSRKGKSSEIIFSDYQSSLRCTPSEWNHIVVTVDRKAPIKLDVNVYFNGALGERIPSPGKLEFDTIAQGDDVEVIVGKSLMTNQLDITGGLGSLPSLKEWRLGPFLVFDEAFSQSQVSRMFLKGPGYVGTFQGESPLEDYLPTVVTDALCRCNTTEVKADEIFNTLGFPSLEYVVEPSLDRSPPFVVQVRMSKTPNNFSR